MIDIHVAREPGGSTVCMPPGRGVIPSLLNDGPINKTILPRNYRAIVISETAYRRQPTLMIDIHVAREPGGSTVCMPPGRGVIPSLLNDGPINKKILPRNYRAIVI